MRWGVVGAGRWGRNIIQTLRRMPDTRLSWIVSRNPLAGDLVEGDCAVQDDWRRAIGSGGADAVAVATPPHTHGDIIAAAVAAGLPVFAEKPLTCDVDEAERLFDLASRANGYVMVDHVHLYSHAYRGLRARLSAVGALRRIQTEAGGWGPFRTDASVLWDWGPHDAAFCLDLMGALPVSADARRIDRRRVEEGWGETLALQAAYPGPVVAEIRLSNLMGGKRRRLLVEGTEGALEYDDADVHKLKHRSRAAADADPAILPVPAEPPLDCALRHFMATVSGGAGSLADLRFGVDVVRMLDAWGRRLGRQGS